VVLEAKKSDNRLENLEQSSIFSFFVTIPKNIKGFKWK
jgi:hypothetical protein